MDDGDEVACSLPPHAGRPFLSRTYQQALTELVRGILGGESFIALTGEPGVGKTTALNAAITVLEEKNLRIRRICNPLAVPLRLPHIIGELLGKLEDGVTDEDVERLFDTLTSGNSAESLVLVFDDAQHIQADVLGYFQIASSLQALGIKHQQVIFAGKPEFWKLLDDPTLCNLVERIKVRPVIEPLDEAEARDFLCYRLEQMYGPIWRHVPDTAFGRLVHHGAGIPARLDAILMDSLAAAVGYQQLRPETVDAAAGAASSVGPSVIVSYAPDEPTRHTVAPRPPSAAIPRAPDRRHQVPHPGALVCLAILLVGGIGTATWRSSVLSGPREASSPAVSTIIPPTVPSGHAQVPASASPPTSQVGVVTVQTTEPSGGVVQRPDEAPSASSRTQPTSTAAAVNPPASSAATVLAAREDASPNSGAAPRQAGTSSAGKAIGPAAPAPTISAMAPAPAQQSPDLSTMRTRTAPSRLTVPLSPELVAELIRLDQTHEFRRVPLPSEMAAELIRRGDKLLGIGNISAARLLYTRAAESDDAKALVQLGKTYDASFLARIGTTGAPTDPAAAARWYRKAIALGDAEAAIMLRRLGHANQ